jgi:hypothetical protein
MGPQPAAVALAANGFHRRLPFGRCADVPTAAKPASRVTKLEGAQTRRLPALPHVPRAEVPQFLGMPSGLGRHVVSAPGGEGGGGGARRIGANRSVSTPDTAGPASRAGNIRWM